MSDYGNAATASGPGKASWDDKAVSEMYISLANIRGGFTAAEAVEVEKDMLSKGYSFTAKQLQYVSSSPLLLKDHVLAYIPC